MKLNTSKILAQLSEQDRNKVELELAELNVHKQRLLNQQQNSISRVQQLNQQRQLDDLFASRYPTATA